jgi:hypothetical protein
MKPIRPGTAQTPWSDRRAGLKRVSGSMWWDQRPRFIAELQTNSIAPIAKTGSNMNELISKSSAPQRSKSARNRSRRDRFVPACTVSPCSRQILPSLPLASSMPSTEISPTRTHSGPRPALYLCRELESIHPFEILSPGVCDSYDRHN